MLSEQFEIVRSAIALDDTKACLEVYHLSKMNENTNEIKVTLFILIK